jgi:hypothetical protein
MIDDPIVEEIHKSRERILEKYRTWPELQARLKEIEKELGAQVVRLEPRKPTETSKKAS